MAILEHETHSLEIVWSDSEATRDFYGQAYGWGFSNATPEVGIAYIESLPNGSLIGIRDPLRESEQRSASCTESAARCSSLGGHAG